MRAAQRGEVNSPLIYADEAHHLSLNIYKSGAYFYFYLSACGSFPSRVLRRDWFKQEKGSSLGFISALAARPEQEATFIRSLL